MIDEAELRKRSRIDQLLAIAESVLSEARKPMSTDEFEAARAKRFAAREAANRKKKIKARMGAIEKAEEGGKKLNPKDIRARLVDPDLRKKKKKKAMPKASGKQAPPTDPPPPPPPPAAGAAAASAGSVHGKIAALEKSHNELRAIVHDAADRGGGAGNALRQARERLRQVGAKADRGQIHAPPGQSVGRRRQMPMPPDEMPGKFARAQDKKSKDLDWLEKERQRRTGVTKSAGKLARMQHRHELLRSRDHDQAKGYDQSPPRTTGKKDHHVASDGSEVHSSGKKDNKKFANATTFRDSDDDAMLHTDKSTEGSRASADSDEFVFKGDTKKDPRQKWYRVSKEGGYASAMASLGKAYHKSPDMRSKGAAKVKSTGFTDASGHQIDVKPTGALHNERGACVHKDTGRLTSVGKALKKHRPDEFYRLCKGPHGGSGTAAGRSEYERGFDPRHDDAHKVRKLHKAAEAGKADKPEKNIAQHMAARPGRRADIHGAVRSIGRKAVRTKWKMRNKG